MKWIFEHGKPENFDQYPAVTNSKKVTPINSDETIRGLLEVSGAMRAGMEEAGSLTVQTEEPEQLLLVTAERGQLQLDSAGQERKLSGGQTILLLPADLPCRLTGREKSTVILLSLTGTLVRQILTEKLETGRIFCPNGAAYVIQTLHVLEQEETTPEDRSSAIYRLLMKLYVSAGQYQESKGYPLLVQTAIEIIHNEFAMLDGIGEIADRLGITSNHLIRLFSGSVGISPGKYLRRRKLECASQLLVQPGMNVTLAAILSGFSEANYFSKIFRQEFGVTPRQYRESHQPITITDSIIKRLLDESAL